MSFLCGGKRAKQILELVHSDVLGCVLVPSVRNFLHYLSFIDDFSRNTWIYFIKKKKVQAEKDHIKHQQQVLQLLKDNATSVQNQTKQQEDQHCSEKCFDVGRSTSEAKFCCKCTLKKG